MGARRKLFWMGCAMAAAIAACKGGGEKGGGTSAPSNTPEEPAPATGTAAPATPSARRRPLSREGSTIARSADGAAVYIADEDSALIHRVAVPVNVKKPALSIPMPGQPAQVLVTHDRVLVTIRSAGAAPPGKGSDAPAPSAAPAASASAGKPAETAKIIAGDGLTVPSATGPGLLLVMKPDAAKGLVEVARVELPQDAWGIAVTKDGATAIVTSAWTHQVSAVDLAGAKVLWSTSVAREPRAVVVREDGKAAYVTHLVGAAVTRIDDLAGPPKVKTITVPPSPLRTPVGQKLGASLTYAAALSPDGRRLFLPRHALGALGSKAWYGAATVDVMLTDSDTPLAPLRRQGVGTVRFNDDVPGYFQKDPMGPGVTPGADPEVFAQPRAMAYRSSKDTVLVVAEGSDALVELDARAVDPSMHVIAVRPLVEERERDMKLARSCGAPSGIALSDDERTAWIHCRSTDDLLEYDLERDKSETRPRPVITLSDYPVTEAYLGRRLFYNATDDITSGGLGCAGCHPEGRDDGHVWHETEAVPPAFKKRRFISSEAALIIEKVEDNGFARQTPMLAGRVNAEGPYGWHGESKTLLDRIKAGFDLHRWDGAYGSAPDIEKRASAIVAYLRKGLVPPPHQDRELSAKEKRGHDVFYSDEALCWTCHKSEPELTNRETYAVFDGLPLAEGLVEDPENKFKTPSLRFVSGTAPYGHDGRFPNLFSIVEYNEDHMGKTSHLSPSDRAALVAFLETL